MRKLNNKGYMTLKIVHPDGKSEWVLEHRIIKEKEVGRKLLRCECVHHKNGDRTDNRPDNLEVVDVKQHAKIHGFFKKQ